MRILVVDDEVSVCSSIAACLRLEGFDVEEAFGSACALGIAAEKGDVISAVLTDVNMPGMDGVEMWSRMKPLVAPDCKILFMSGMAHKYMADGSIFPGELLQKPFSFGTLIEKLGAGIQ